ncbi:MAG TPA: sialidase family protein [Chitinophagaceae bacterium]|nr:sialidase family protein [Chitinophagaceae bacterium]
MTKRIWFVIISFLLLSSCRDQSKKNDVGINTIANGQMPAITADDAHSLHIVFGKGDSIMYTASDKTGSSFSLPVVIDTLHGLVAFATRGPQISTTKNGLAVIAVDKNGDIFSYIKDAGAKWNRAGKVNDADTTDKEGFLGLSSDGENNLFAIWTDLRNDKHNKIFGARSTDGGKTWHKNILVYASPDSTVCECCKPSIVMKGADVFVMFRNWLQGNRDLYVIRSSDGGETFGEATKLGKGSWALNGCPMDGGGVALNNEGAIQTVWRRESKIYSCEPGKIEKEIGEGKSCTMETVNNNNMYAWTDNGNVTCLLPDGSKKVIGKGSLPVLKSINNNEVICVWENNEQIESYLLHL